MGRSMNSAVEFLRRTLVVATTASVLIACSEEPGPGYVPTPSITNSEGRVTISGTPLVGSTLTADISDPDGATSNVAYTWSANSADIADAAMSSYTLTEAEVGSTITVSVRYTDAAGFLETLTSTPTAVVASRANEPGSIAISGVPSRGRTLTAVITDDNGVSGDVAYQWAADGNDIDGATEETYPLGDSDVDTEIVVRADYTDDDGYVESVVSMPVGPVTATVTNVIGVVSIMGRTVVGNTVSAEIDDANGVADPVTYQWRADGNDIVGATSSTFMPTLGERGATLTVEVSYTDDDGFVEGPTTASAPDIVYSAIVTGEASLRAAATTATVGDIIGLDDPADGEDYTDMEEIDFDIDRLLIRRTAGSNAVISGATCIVVSGDDTVVDGLLFERLDWRGNGTCDSNGDASIYLSGSRVTLRNCEFRSEASPRTVQKSDPYHYLALKGVDNVVERNLFQGKDMDNEGSAITMFANRTPMTNQGHTVQYNLFIDMPGASGTASERDSGAHAIQVGRTTGNDAQGEGLFTIQYNRFENIQSERRLMRVQSSRNVIHGNTVVNSLGMIALEDGFANTVTKNVFLSGGADNDDGGISFAPLGHTITDNYINNIRTTSSQRAALLINPDPLSGSGNRAIVGTAGLDYTVVVARNSIVNANRGISFEDADCSLLAPILDFDQNLILNQSEMESINNSENGDGRDAVTDGDFVAASCSLDPASDFDDNHFYSAGLSQSGTFDFNGAAADNVVGGEDGEPFMVDANNLLSATGASVGIGVNTSTLTVVQRSQVGPGSTWSAP